MFGVITESPDTRCEAGRDLRDQPYCALTARLALSELSPIRAASGSRVWRRR
jgi:hypothetical protein